VTLTRVEVTPDLSLALVYWSTLAAGEDAVQETQAGLESAAAHARGCLARALPLRRIPALRFRHDPSLELGSRTLETLRELRGDGEA
jgi:ribosome-binding factor A